MNGVDSTGAASRLDASEFCNKVQAATDVLQDQITQKNIVDASITGGLVILENFQNLVVVGDLHGDSVSLSRVLGNMNSDVFLNDQSNKIIFLGDYADRGPDSLGVLHSICSLKKDHPQNVFLMRGNHETPKQFPFSSHDLPNRIAERFGVQAGRRIYNAVLDLFELLTIVVIVRHHLVIVHGGLPVMACNHYEEQFSTANRSSPTNRVMEEILWNDPRDLNSCEWEKSRRGFGNHFGKSVTMDWLSLTNTRAILRGHEPCKGFKLDHDDRILTLFSSKAAYPNFEASFLAISKSELANCNDAKDVSKFVRLLSQ